MNYSTDPPDCTEIVEKDIIPEILKRIKYFCISGIVLIVFILIRAFYEMPEYIFLALMVIFLANAGYWSTSLRRVKCPNCKKPLLKYSMMVPKSCYYCHAKLKF